MDENIKKMVRKLLIIFCTALIISLIIEIIEIHIIVLHEWDFYVLIISLLLKIIVFVSAFAVLVKFILHRFSKEVYYDSMTGLYSRRKLHNDLNRLIYLNKRFTLCYIDFNNFKHVNDTYGHAAGDILLNEFSKRIYALTCDKITCYRVGGDEFAIIIKNVPNAHICANCILGIADKEIQISKTKAIKVKFAMGIVDNDFISTADELMKRADFNMYKNKRT